MPAVPEVGAPVSPLLVAALLLAAGEHLRTLGLPHPTVQQVIEATGASRSRAYELRDAMLVGLASLLRPVGRPPAPTRAVEPDTVHELGGYVMTFVMSHPGCVYGGAERRRYDDPFRRFVLDLREQHPDLDLDLFADAIRVPLGTLKEWLGRGPESGTGEPGEDASMQDDKADDASTGSSSQSAQIQTMLSSWKTWRGSFGDFCLHVRDQQRVSFGRSIISQILFVNGQRRPQRR